MTEVGKVPGRRWRATTSTQLLVISGVAHRWRLIAASPGLGQHRYEVYAVAFSPDGKALATASEDRTARLWDAATLKPLGTTPKHQGWVQAVAFSLDGKALATASRARESHWNSEPTQGANPYYHCGWGLTDEVAKATHETS